MCAKKVLVVDDSALVRKQLGELFDQAGFDVGLAKNGQEAVEFVQSVDFDVITMDINMPVMDGMTAVKEIMKIKPTPIIMVSSLTQEEAEITLDALELGAVDFVPKPGTLSVDLKRQKDDILQKVTAAANIPASRIMLKRHAKLKQQEVVEKKHNQHLNVSTTPPKKLVLIGASTGGPGLIEEIITSLPADYPYPVCVVQHMPDNFTAIFANRLNKNAQVEVCEAKSGDKLTAGKAIIGKGGRHLHFMKKASGHLAVKLVPNTINHFFCPSVDEMFCSANSVFDAHQILAVELTGIGDDGADCLVKLHQAGAYTLAESEETAVVYGMPKAAWERGGATKKLPFPKIVEEVLKFGKGK